MESPVNTSDTWFFRVGAGGGGAASAVAATTQNDSLGGIFKHFAPYGRAIRTAAGTDLGVSPFAIAS